MEAALDSGTRGKIVKLTTALKEGDMDALSKWLRDGGRAIINEPIPSPNRVTTPLALAAQLDCPDGVRRLLASHASVDPPSPQHGQSAMLMACLIGNKECVRCLLGARASLEWQSPGDLFSEGASAIDRVCPRPITLWHTGPMTLYNNTPAP